MNKTIVLTLDLETLPPHFKAHIGRDSKTTEILLKENLTNLKCTLRSSTKLFYLFHHFVKFWWKLQIKMIFKKVFRNTFHDGKKTKILFDWMETVPGIWRNDEWTSAVLCLLEKSLRQMFHLLFLLPRQKK